MRSARELERIRAIVIPPAWTDVWISPLANGHLQAIGRDARRRRQYRYHPRFRARRDAGKFARLADFGRLLPRLRRRVRRDLGARGLPKDKVLAAVVSLLDSTSLRIGGESYARLNRSFGISTLRGRHATVTASRIRFRFRGKGGRPEERDLVDRRLAGVVRRCQALPGQLLFQYVDEEGEARAISSEDVNAYLRDATGSDEVSAKDFRTWTASVLAYRALREPAASEGRRSRTRSPIAEALRRAADELGDTVAVTRSAYVHPAVLEAFEEPGAEANSGAPAASRRSTDGRPDRADERALLDFLRKLPRGRRDRSGEPARRSKAGSRRVVARAMPSRS